VATAAALLAQLSGPPAPRADVAVSATVPPGSRKSVAGTSARSVPAGGEPSSGFC